MESQLSQTANKQSASRSENKNEEQDSGITMTTKPMIKTTTTTVNGSQLFDDKQFNYELIVPISVACLEERADDGTCSRSCIECISWCQLDAKTGEIVMKRRAYKLSEKPNSLAKAIKQIDKSIGDKRCLLITCGSLALRQHLHPAAMKAKLELSDHYDRYADLTKEFCRRYGPLRSTTTTTTIAHHQQANNQSQWHQHTIVNPESAPNLFGQQPPLPVSMSAISCASSSSSSSSAYASLDGNCNGSIATSVSAAAAAAAASASLPNGCCQTITGSTGVEVEEEEAAADSSQHPAQEYCYCCDYYATHDAYDSNEQQQQQHHQMNPFYPMQQQQQQQQQSSEHQQHQQQGQNYDQLHNHNHEQQQHLTPDEMMMLQLDESNCQFHNTHQLQINEQQEQQQAIQHQQQVGCNASRLGQPALPPLKAAGYQTANCQQQQQQANANRQVEEMLRLLSIESSSSSSSNESSQKKSLLFVEEACELDFKLEHVLWANNCENCHLVAENELQTLARDNNNDDRNDKRNNNNKTSTDEENEEETEITPPPTTTTTAAAARQHDNNNSIGGNSNTLNGDNAADNSQQEASFSLKTGKDHLVGQPTLAEATTTTTNSMAIVITPKAHCSACSILMSIKLIDSMSLIINRMINEGHQFNRIEGIKRRVEVGLCEESGRDNEQKVVRARGLPWQATEQDIANFFVGLNIARGGVGLCLSRQGRRNGEALIQFESREHRNLALSRHKHFMGTRYIEVYRANSDDFLNLASGYNNNKAQPFLSRGAQVIVRMRGLPFTCTSKQVLDFFSGSSGSNNNNNNNNKNNNNNQQQQQPYCEVLGQEEGVLFVKNQDEKPTGDAFVLFANEEFASRALQKHKQNIGSRYVELFRSTISEVQQVLSISSMESGNNNNNTLNGPFRSSPNLGNQSPLINQLVLGATKSPLASQQQALNGRNASAVAAANLASTATGASNNNNGNSNKRGGGQTRSPPIVGGGQQQPPSPQGAWSKPHNGITYAQVAISSIGQSNSSGGTSTHLKTTATTTTANNNNNSKTASQDHQASKKASGATRSLKDKDSSVAISSDCSRANANDIDSSSQAITTNNGSSSPTITTTTTTLTSSNETSTGATLDASSTKSSSSASSSNSSAFDNNSLNSSCDSNNISTNNNSANPPASNEGRKSVNSNNGTTGSSADHQQLLPSSSGSSTAQSPISIMSAASTGSSSYKSSQYGGYSRHHNGLQNGPQNQRHHHNSHHHHQHPNANHYNNYRNNNANTNHQQHHSHSQYQSHHHFQQQQQHHYAGSGPYHYMPAAPPMVSPAAYPGYPLHHQTSGHHQRAQYQPLHSLAAYHHQAAHHPYGAPMPSDPHQVSQHPMTYGPPPPAHLFPSFYPPHHMHPAALPPNAYHDANKAHQHQHHHQHSQATTLVHPSPLHQAANTSSSSTSTSSTTTTATTTTPIPTPTTDGNNVIPTQHNKRDCIRLRGLPFEAQVEDVLYFLGDQSKNIVYQGVHMVYSAQGQPTGEAIIQMNSCPSASQAAQDFHKKVMSVGKKQRYIEVIPCSIDDMNLVLGVGYVGRSMPAVTPLIPAAAQNVHYPAQHFRPPPLYASPGQPIAAATVTQVAASGVNSTCPLEPAAVSNDQNQVESGQLVNGTFTQHQPYTGHHHHQTSITSGQVEQPATVAPADGETPKESLASLNGTASKSNPEVGDGNVPDSTTAATIDGQENGKDTSNTCSDCSLNANSIISSSSSSSSGSNGGNINHNNNGHTTNNKLSAHQTEASLMPAAYYPILYYYPQQMLYQHSHR